MIYISIDLFKFTLFSMYCLILKSNNIININQLSFIYTVQTQHIHSNKQSYTLYHIIFTTQATSTTPFDHTSVFYHTLQPHTLHHIHMHTTTQTLFTTNTHSPLTHSSSHYPLYHTNSLDGKLWKSQNNSFFCSAYIQIATGQTKFFSTVVERQLITWLIICYQSLFFYYLISNYRNSIF